MALITKDLLHSLAKYKDYFEKLAQTIEIDYKLIAARNVACAGAKRFFGVLCTGQQSKSPMAYGSFAYENVQQSQGPRPTFEAQTTSSFTR